MDFEKTNTNVGGTLMTRNGSSGRRYKERGKHTLYVEYLLEFC